MPNLEEDKTTLMVPVADTYEDLIRRNSEDAIDLLNSGKARMIQPHFLPLKSKISGLVKYVKD